MRVILKTSPCTLNLISTLVFVKVKLISYTIEIYICCEVVTFKLFGFQIFWL